MFCHSGGHSSQGEISWNYESEVPYALLGFTGMSHQLCVPRVAILMCYIHVCIINCVPTHVDVRRAMATIEHGFKTTSIHIIVILHDWTAPGDM